MRQLLLRMTVTVTARAASATTMSAIMPASEVSGVLEDSAAEEAGVEETAEMKGSVEAERGAPVHGPTKVEICGAPARGSLSKKNYLAFSEQKHRNVRPIR